MAVTLGATSVKGLCVTTLADKKRHGTRVIQVMAVLMAAAVAAAAVGAASPAAAQGDSGSFNDDDGSVHEPALEAMVRQGILEGTECSEGDICPDDPIKRWTMAVWLTRALEDDEPAAADRSRFVDVDPSEWWVGHLERFADLGVTHGCGSDPPQYCPLDDVTRGQMAALLVRAFELDDTSSAGFSDTQGHLFEADIDALANASVTHGCTSAPPRYCPNDSVTRGQMATFIARALDLLDPPDKPDSSELGEPIAEPTHYTAVSTGSFHTCALRDNHTIACWGNDNRGLSDAPPGTYKAISAAESHTCALRTDGTIACWGTNTQGQSDAPPGTYLAIDAGTWYSCAVAIDGTLACWGSADHVDAPPGSRYKAVAVAEHHACAIRTVGTIACWSGHSDVEIIPPQGQYKAISSGLHHFCAIRTNSTIACWGDDSGGRASPPAGIYKAISAGQHSTCAIRTNSTVKCWGDTFIERIGPSPRGLFTDISLSIWGHSCGLHIDGTISCWGQNRFGETEVPELFDPVGVRLSSGVAPVIGVTESFEVTVEFERPVHGFAANDISVVNGKVVRLAGSGSRYRATIEPTVEGTIVVLVHRGTTLDGRGNRNDKSQPLATTAVANGTAPLLGIDTWDRDAVLAAYAAEFDRTEPDSGFTGDVNNCVAGTTGQPFRSSVVQRVNWYRSMAGLHPVTENREASNLAQHVALMMAAEENLSHHPDPAWSCYSAQGARGAGTSNLSLGDMGVDAIDGYMQDPGRSNTSVGHRRWILYPRLTTIGTGDVPRVGDSGWWGNALLLDTFDAPYDVRAQRGFVSWPPPGYVPPDFNWARWSFALEGADFSEASVKVNDNFGAVDIEIISSSATSGTPAIVWDIGGAGESHRLPAPATGDQCYAVTVSGVQMAGTFQAPYEYAVCVLDLEHPLPRRFPVRA